MSRATERFVSGDSACFDSRYEAADFEFGHTLAAHPAFEWDALRQLLARHLGQSENCYWSSGAVGIKDPWTAGTQARQALLETFSSIATGDSLIILKCIETDPVLGPFVRLIMDELIERVGGRLRDDILKARATLLIASPYRTTSYHIDGDTNFLFQIRGRKFLHVHSKFDRRAVPETELENYFAGNANGAVFKEAYLHTARQYPLDPGIGIHIPSGAPHWAQTLDSVSVALSVNFDLCSIDRQARLYRMNARLRHIGLNPTAPGQSAGLDAIKLTLHGLMRAARRAAMPRTTLVSPPRV